MRTCRQQVAAEPASVAGSSLTCGQWHPVPRPLAQILRSARSCPYDRSLRITSFMPQCHYGIDLHRATRWEVTGCGRDRGQQHRDGNEGQGIRGSNAEQET